MHGETGGGRGCGTERWPTWFRLLICSCDDSGVAGMTTTWGVWTGGTDGGADVASDPGAGADVVAGIGADIVAGAGADVVDGAGADIVAEADVAAGAGDDDIVGAGGDDVLSCTWNSYSSAYSCARCSSLAWYSAPLMYLIRSRCWPSQSISDWISPSGNPR